MDNDTAKVLAGLLQTMMGQVSNGTRTLAQLRLFTEGQNPFSSRMDIIDEWGTFYSKYFGIDVDFSQVAVPVVNEGGYRLIINAVPSYNLAIDRIRRCFEVWLRPGFEDLDRMMLPDIRRVDKGPYAILFRPDSHKSKGSIFQDSGFQGDDKGSAGVTLMERLIFELKHWSETGRHPEDYGSEPAGWSKCSGSRFKDGAVPHIVWRGKSLEIDQR
jgi:hypothetical protein